METGEGGGGEEHVGGLLGGRECGGLAKGEKGELGPTLRGGSAHPAGLIDCCVINERTGPVCRHRGPLFSPGWDYWCTSQQKAYAALPSRW